MISSFVFLVFFSVSLIFSITVWQVSHGSMARSPGYSGVFRYYCSVARTSVTVVARQVLFCTFVGVEAQPMRTPVDGWVMQFEPR